MGKNDHRYYEIFKEFKDMIISKKLKSGTKLTPERELANKYLVSRNTIRTMLSLLEKEGYIYKIHGKGNFVSSEKINQNLNDFYSFFENIKSSGKEPNCKILTSDIIKANTFFSEIFKIPINSKLIYFERLRFIDNEPIIFEKTYLPLSRFPDFNPHILNKNSMYNVFSKKYNVSFLKATEVLKPINIDTKKIIKLLNLTTKDIGMNINRTTFEINNKIIEYTESIIKNNVFEYKITLNKGW